MGYRSLTIMERKRIAFLYDGGARVTEIAHEIDCHPSTIYDELRRGSTGEINGNLKPGYDPDLGQRRYDANVRRRGNRKKKAATT